MLFFSQEKDNYGNEVTQLARPLPVEYLLTTLPAAFASDFHYTFKSNLQPSESFPVENRESTGHMQVSLLIDGNKLSILHTHLHTTPGLWHVSVT